MLQRAERTLPNPATEETLEGQGVRADDGQSPKLVRAPNNSCTRCLEWDRPATNVHAILHGEWPACLGCAGQDTIKIAVEQYCAQQPRWWLVNGVLAAPIWVIERFGRSHRRHISPNYSR
jgi:hypothetical protein